MIIFNIDLIIIITEDIILILVFLFLLFYFICYCIYFFSATLILWYISIIQGFFILFPLDRKMLNCLREVFFFHLQSCLCGWGFYSTQVGAANLFIVFMLVSGIVLVQRIPYSSIRSWLSKSHFSTHLNFKSFPFLRLSHRKFSCLQWNESFCLSLCMPSLAGVLQICY